MTNDDLARIPSDELPYPSRTSSQRPGSGALVRATPRRETDLVPSRPETSGSGRNRVAAAAVLGAFLGLGVAVAGVAVGSSIAKSRSFDRYVSVKGVAERDLDADFAVWPIVFKESAHELALLQKQIDAKRVALAEFLVASGFDWSELSFPAPRFADVEAATGGAEAQSPAPLRYAAQVVVTVRSKNVTRVMQTMEQAGALVGQGYALVQDRENPPEFLFLGLNRVKPDLIEEATASARATAAKFAADSGSQIGAIRKASQGLFTVTDRDSNSPEKKVVRVVTTVEYFLVD